MSRKIKDTLHWKTWCVKNLRHKDASRVLCRTSSTTIDLCRTSSTISWRSVSSWRVSSPRIDRLLDSRRQSNWGVWVQWTFGDFVQIRRTCPLLRYGIIEIRFRWSRISKISTLRIQWLSVMTYSWTKSTRSIMFSFVYIRPFPETRIHDKILNTSLIFSVWLGTLWCPQGNLLWCFLIYYWDTDE